MPVILSTAALLILLGVSGGSWYLWSLEPPALIPSGRYIGALGATLFLAGILWSFVKYRTLPALRAFADPRIWGLGLVIIFVSGWMNRAYNLYQGPTIRIPITIGAIAVLILPQKLLQRLLIALPIITSAILAWAFFTESNGRLLFSDDHAMFLFRLKLLKENFPSIPFWFPLWNGGIDARDFFATGALNAFLLSSPLIYSFPIERVYNVIIALLLWVVTPCVTYLATRLMEAPRRIATVAATIVMCSGLFWYRWALKYGTVGFVVSTALIPLVVALTLRFINTKQLRLRDSLSLVVAATLMLLWSPSGIALVPLALFALPRATKLLSSPRHLITIALLIALNLPWMAMMWKVSNVGKFLDSEQKAATQQTQVAVQGEQPQDGTPDSNKKLYRHAAGSIDPKKALKQWQEGVGSTSPLVVLLALPGIMLLAAPYRRPFAVITGWLVLLGTVGVSLKPQLELDRMLVIAAVLSAFPIAHMIGGLITARSQGATYKLAGAVMGGFLLAGPFAGHEALRNKLADRYSFAGPEVAALSQTIATHSHGGRALFSGCVLHELSGGHLAPLPFWSKTPLIATSYAHNIWHYEQPIPASFLKEGDAGVKRFFDLMNVTLVTAHEPHWRAYFSERPVEYQEIAHHEKFIVYQRLGVSPSYALEGGAENLTQDSNSIEFTPGTERVVLKFKYQTFLTASQCAIKPFPVAPELSFIELSGCHIGERVSVHSVSPWERLVQ